MTKKQFEKMTNNVMKARNAFKEAEKAYKEAKEELAKALASYTEDEKADMLYATSANYKKSYIKHTLDSARLKVERPEIYEAYLKESLVKESIS